MHRSRQELVGDGMMLNIKLPKGKVARACECAAEQCSQRIAVENTRYFSELEQWRKDSNQGAIRTVERCAPPDKPRSILVLTQERKRLHDMADMAKHSTGDVYVSLALWAEIKGYYDA